MGFGSRFIKFISANWWIFYGILVIVLFFWNYIAGIVAIVLGVVLGFFILVIKRRKKASLSRALLGVDKISEHELAQLTGSYVEDAHAFLHDISRNPDASGISILIKGEYIYFSNDAIKKFKKLYKEGKNTKEILEEHDIFETREEVKKMLDKLKEFDELPERPKKLE